MKTVILIGGAPGTGKSTLAKKLSKHLSLPWISTDQLRGIVRDYATRDRYPDLLLPEDCDTAELFLTKYTAKEIAEMEYQQAYDVWPAVEYLVTENYAWKEGVLIEGVNIVPELLEKIAKDTVDLHALFLIDEDHDRLKDVVYGRGIWDKADTYSDDLKPKEIEWVSIFTKMLKESSQRHGFTALEVQKDDNDIEMALHVLKL